MTVDAADGNDEWRRKMQRDAELLAEAIVKGADAPSGEALRRFPTPRLPLDPD